MENWISINRKTFIQDIETIGKIGFAILSLLLVESQRRNYAYISLCLIQDLLQIKDIRTVRKYLIKLVENNYIKTNLDITSVNKNYLIVVDIYYKEITLNNTKNFERIKVKAFSLYTTIGETGWCLYCLLAIKFNRSLGYAYPSHEKIIKELNISTKTLVACKQKLIDNNLIKIINNNWYVIVNKNKEEEWLKEAHKYIIL